MRRLSYGFSLILVCCFGGCSDDSTPLPDASVDTSGGEPDGASADMGKLWSCDTPNQPCNAHDSCAINPICGSDLLCRPSGRQNCDDGLECTEDTCGGLGRCDNSPKTGFCVIRNRDSGQLECYAKDDLQPGDPCAICDPEEDPLGWSPRNGGACDDGTACTKEDYCQDGVCKGTDYGSQCTDDLTCTVDCDGRGGCITPVVADDACMIEGTCVSAGSKDTTGCGVCDPTSSKDSWTPVGMVCLIDNKCVQSGTKHRDGCAECAPTKNTRGWTVTGDSCLIGDSCIESAATDTLECGKCDPNKNKYGWTPISGKCTIEGRCYNKDDKAPDRDCAVCDPDKNAEGWTVPGDACLIDKTCMTPAQTNDTGCLSCQPTSDKYAWSAVANKCNIEGACHDEGTEHESKCLVCSYAKAKDFWSVKDGLASSSETFDASVALPTGWSETHTDPAVKWQVRAGKESASGQNALYYGDSSADNYLGGASIHSGEAVWKGVALPAGGANKVVLVFKVFLAVETRSNFDVLAIYVTDKDGEKKMVWDKSKVDAGQYNGWVQQVVDLSAYADQTVDVSFLFHTVDATQNRGHGVYLDDISLVSGC